MTDSPSMIVQRAFEEWMNGTGNVGRIVVEFAHPRNLRCAGPFDSDVGPSWWGVRRA